MNNPSRSPYKRLRLSRPVACHLSPTTCQPTGACGAHAFNGSMSYIAAKLLVLRAVVLCEKTQGLSKLKNLLYPWSRFPPLPMCGAYTIVGYCGSFLNKLRPYHFSRRSRCSLPQASSCCTLLVRISADLALSMAKQCSVLSFAETCRSTRFVDNPRVAGSQSTRGGL